ncbi:MAG: fructose 1,6-bisphosphatase [Candidatus Latescibacteria bacterium]|nr:fructose 1,6-bisphosphatase [bacterium]MBD3423372.1 fructose 1,6-bisphosphatase [Candidatus Latescibacterota bacterium]
MQLALSLVKADIGSFKGYINPDVDSQNQVHVHVHGNETVNFHDFWISSAGDNFEKMVSSNVEFDNIETYDSAWNAFEVETGLDIKVDLYGAGEVLQEIMSNDYGEEMAFKIQANGTLQFSVANKIEFFTCCLPLYITPCNPTFFKELILSPWMSHCASLDIMDTNINKERQVILVRGPSYIYNILNLIQNSQIHSSNKIIVREKVTVPKDVNTTNNKGAGKHTINSNPPNGGLKRRNKKRHDREILQKCLINLMISLSAGISVLVWEGLFHQLYIKSLIINDVLGII